LNSLSTGSLVREQELRPNIGVLDVKVEVGVSLRLERNDLDGEISSFYVQETFCVLSLA
jgi:hypothetical protein